MPKRLVVVVGERRGGLVYLAERPRRGRARYAMFRCDCGAEHETSLYNWVGGRLKSCGCQQGSGNRTHGLSRTPMYLAYSHMQSRTSEKGWAYYPTYKGTRRDPRWDTFDGFLAHPPAGEFEPGKVLGRYGDAGDYTPENCRWLTRSENSREGCETRQQHMHVLPDGRYAIDVSRSNGIKDATFRARLCAGWTLHEAATLPVGPRGSHGRTIEVE